MDSERVAEIFDYSFRRTAEENTQIEYSKLNNASKKLHDYLVKLASELTEYANVTMYSTIAITTNFDCIECGQQICRNVASLKDGDIIECLNKALKDELKAISQDFLI